MTERWKPIPGYEYEVSDHGRVYSGITDRILIPSCNPRTNYLTVNLRRNCKAKATYIHRLVAFAFVGDPPSPKHRVVHKDRDRANNVHTNLEWKLPPHRARRELQALRWRPRPSCACARNAETPPRLQALPAKGTGSTPVHPTRSADVAARNGKQRRRTTSRSRPRPALRPGIRRASRVNFQAKRPANVGEGTPCPPWHRREPSDPPGQSYDSLPTDFSRIAQASSPYFPFHSE